MDVESLVENFTERIVRMDENNERDCNCVEENERLDKDVEMRDAQNSSIT